MDDRFNRKDKPEGQEVIVSHDADGGLVLLHRIALDTSASEAARQALLDTTHASSAFRHPHVLAVREVRLEDGSLVFVQEHPEGPLLADKLEKDGPIPLLEALTWMRQFAQALDAAQSSGLTLSQICPTEFIVQEASPGGLLCLCPPVPAGWWLDVEDAAFASPEQKASQACDIRSTMYSAGAVLAAMLTNQRPSDAAGWSKILTKAKLPKAANRALYAALEMDQAKRCATPADWVALLDQAIASIPSPEIQPAAIEPAKKEASSKRAVMPIAGNKPQDSSRVELGEAMFEAPAGHLGKRGLSPVLMAVVAVVLVFGTWMLLPKKESATVAVSPQPTTPVQEKPFETATQPPVVADKPAPPVPPAAPPTVEPKPAVATATPSIPPPPATPVPAEIPSPAPVAKPPAMPTPPPSSPEVVARPAPAASPGPAKVETKPVAEAKPEAASKPATVAAMPPAPIIPVVSPPAPIEEAKKPSPPATMSQAAPAPAIVVTKPQPISKDELLQQAAQATGAERTDLYRKVLAMEARNAKALHGLVESTLSDLPTEGEKRSEFAGWAEELVSLDDPLGTHALASLALQQASAAKNRDAAIRIFTPAIAQLKTALHSGNDSSYPVLIQACIDLHQAHILNHEKPKADRVSKALQDEIARTPSSIPAKVPAAFAARIEALLKERAAKGPPRMQEAFLKTVMQSLNAVAKRGEAPPKKQAKPRR